MLIKIIFIIIKKIIIIIIIIITTSLMLMRINPSELPHPLYPMSSANDGNSDVHGVEGVTGLLTPAPERLVTRDVRRQTLLDTVQGTVYQ